MPLEPRTPPPAYRPLPIYNNPRVRAAFYQLALLAAVVCVGYAVFANARDNLAARHIASGFGFFDHTAGFGVSQTLIPYSETDTYGRVFIVGLLNTLIVAAVGIVFATVLGFMVGIARLSNNWLVGRLAAAYVEVIRNLPLLFQILFWYLAVLGSLPAPRRSISLFGVVFLSNRGIIVPHPTLGSGAGIVIGSLLMAILVALVLHTIARRHRLATGRKPPSLWIRLGLIAAPPLVALAIWGFPITFEWPELRGFNFVGGDRIIPEFVALVVALIIYTASFIAEIVRAGLLAVPRGQVEAAYSLGLRPAPTLRLIMVPQALRVIIPPLTSQYLNLTKNSSLAVAIGYPDFFAVFAGTTLNQTGQAIEIIAITMGVYLTISLVTSLLMNWYNARVGVVER
jgi:general L-amino acid transport system permease protein